MRALLISLDGIKEVQIDTGGNTLKDMYKHIGCDLVTGAGYPDQGHACWADDEGLLTMESGEQLNIVSWYPERLVGKLLVTGFDPETGDTTPATMSRDDLLSMVKIGVLLLD